MKLYSKTAIFRLTAGLLLLIIIAILFVSLRQSNKLRNTIGWVEHTEDVIVKLQKIVGTSVELQAHLKDVKITGNENQLKPGDELAQSVIADADALKQLVQDNSSQKKLADSIRFYIQKQIELSRQVTAPGKENDSAGITKTMTVRQGQLYIDKVKSFKQEMEAAEELLLAQRRKSSDQSILDHDILMYCLLAAVSVLIYIFFRYLQKDIKRREQYHHQLEVLRQQIDESNDAIFTTDGDMTIMSWNKGCEKLFGYTKEKAVGQKSMELLQVNLTEAEINAMRLQVENGGYWSMVVNRKEKDNKLADVVSSITAIKNSQGNITGYISVNYDRSVLKQLRQQIDYLASIVDQSSEAILSCNAEDIVLSWNGGAEKLFGYSKQEAIGKKIEALALLKLTDDEKIVMLDTLKKGFSWQVEKGCCHKSGSRFIGEITASKIKDGYNAEEFVMFIIRDITPRRRFEEYLRHANEELEVKVAVRAEEIIKAESRYRETLENMLEGVQIIGNDLRYIYVNEAMAQQAGMARDEITGKHVSEVLIGVQETPLYAVLFDCMQHKKQMQFETAFKLPEKAERYYQLSVLGMPEGIVILSVDITERKQAEAKLEQSLVENKKLVEKFSVILNTVPANIVLLNEQGVIIEVNEAWKMFSIENGLQGDNYGLGKNYIEVSLLVAKLGVADAQNVAAGIKAVLNHSRHSFEYEYSCSNKEKQSWYRMLAVPLHHSVYDGAVVTHVDITDMKLMEAERLKTKADEYRNITRTMLEGQEKERSEIGNELHDSVTQLMSAIKMKLGLYISMTHAESPLLEQAMENIQTVLEETKNLSYQMVIPQFGPGFFESYIQQMLTDYISVHRKVSSHFENFVDEKIPTQIKETLYRIAQEQLVNIEKHAAASHITITIKGFEKIVSMEIKDDGIGFDMAEKNKGIGLDNIQHRAESYGGTVSVTSSPGNGCVLKVDMPLDQM